MVDTEKKALAAMHRLSQPPTARRTEEGPIHAQMVAIGELINVRLEKTKGKTPAKRRESVVAALDRYYRKQQGEGNEDFAYRGSRLHMRNFAARDGSALSDGHAIYERVALVVASWTRNGVVRDDFVEELLYMDRFAPYAEHPAIKPAVGRYRTMVAKKREK